MSSYNFNPNFNISDLLINYSLYESVGFANGLNSPTELR